ncbi:MAG: DUF2207 domain-containing protein [Zetaproteobacteria bacterium]|nr:MAG: DUF2207 domain-containing protein [Zetaproteobacteria bacterium]
MAWVMTATIGGIAAIHGQGMVSRLFAGGMGLVGLGMALFIVGEAVDPWTIFATAGGLLCAPVVPAAIVGVALWGYARRMSARTAKGMRLLKQALGFRRFVETADAPRIRALVDQDPGYIERTLPYVAAFGLLPAWGAQAAELAPDASWLEGMEIVDVAALGWLAEGAIMLLGEAAADAW